MIHLLFSVKSLDVILDSTLSIQPISSLVKTFFSISSLQSSSLSSCLFSCLDYATPFKMVSLWPHSTPFNIFNMLLFVWVFQVRKTNHINPPTPPPIFAFFTCYPSLTTSLTDWTVFTADVFITVLPITFLLSSPYRLPSFSTHLIQQLIGFNCTFPTQYSVLVTSKP